MIRRSVKRVFICLLHDFPMFVHVLWKLPIQRASKRTSKWSQRNFTTWWSHRYWQSISSKPYGACSKERSSTGIASYQVLGPVDSCSLTERCLFLGLCCFLCLCLCLCSLPPRLLTSPGGNNLGDVFVDGRPRVVQSRSLQDDPRCSHWSREWVRYEHFLLFFIYYLFVFRVPGFLAGIWVRMFRCAFRGSTTISCVQLLRFFGFWRYLAVTYIWEFGAFF